MSLFKLIIKLFFIHIISASSAQYRDGHSQNIHMGLSAICLDSSKLLLEWQNINLSFNINNIPLYPINITLISDNNFKYFNVSDRNIIFPSGYESITLENNTKALVKKKNYELSQTFYIKKIESGISKLSFDIKTNETNLTYDKHIKDSITIDVLGVVLTPPFYIIIIATFFFIFSTGLSLSGYTLKKIFTSKESVKPVICGVLLQFIIIPLFATLITLLFRQTNYQAFSVFLVAISPGSIIAPVFTYYIGGDRALATSLCLITTILGSLLYPYFMWIYFSFSAMRVEMFRFDYLFLLCIVIYLLLPLSFGILIQHYRPLWASWLKNGIPFWGTVTIVTSFVVALKDFIDVFSTNWTIYFISIILTSGSLAISALTSKLFGLNSQKN